MDGRNYGRAARFAQEAPTLGGALPYNSPRVRKTATGVAIGFVLVGYVFFGTYGRFSFHGVPWDQGSNRPGDHYYAMLAEGFSRGHLYLPVPADPALMALPYPYDKEARDAKLVSYLWDASYLNGRYYLYFSPLPVLLFYLPVKWTYGLYPSDHLASTFFASWGFVMAALFVGRALGKRRNVPLPVWIVMLGFAGVVPFVMTYSRIYEVATMCAMAMAATWAYCLLRYVESRSTRALLWTSFFLALTIVARPNLGVLLLPSFLALPKPRLKPMLIALIPLSIFGLATLAYNYARYHNPLEFGHRYQLTYMPMEKYHVCGCRNVREGIRFLNSTGIYLFSPPFFYGDFPFVGLQHEPLDKAVSFQDISEEVGGLTPLIPLAMIGTLIAVVWFARKEPLDDAARAAVLVLGGGWIVLAGLSACWFLTARYETDFTLLITAGAIVCLDRFLNTRRLRALAIVLALYATLTGILLGFKGTDGAFARENPKLFNRVASWFTSSSDTR